MSYWHRSANVDCCLYSMSVFYDEERISKHRMRSSRRSTKYVLIKGNFLLNYVFTF